MVKEELRPVFDEVSSGPGGVGTGPMSILKYSPEMSRRAIPLFNYVRNESSLPQWVRELAMLVTARSMDCPYIWNAHAPAARHEGVSDAVVDALRDRQPLPSMPADEAAIVKYCTEFYTNHRVASSTFQVAKEQFGVQHLVEITALMGNYAQTAFFLNAFEVELPDERTEKVLPVG
jgi:4-carboxymuconolactone decarboxylase